MPPTTDPLRRVREGNVLVPSARLYFREVGRGQPLVVLHGGPDFNHHYLLPELDRLSDAFRLVYYDQRGRGKSAAGVAPESVSLESEVDDLDRLRRHLGLDSMSLLGHSWGALLAMEYATRRAGRLSHLILMNTAPASHADLSHFRTRRELREAQTLAKMRAIARSTAYLEGDIGTEAEYYRLHYGKAVCCADGIDTIVGRLRTHFTPEDILKARAIEARLCAQTWDARDYDLPTRLRETNVPTLVIHGNHDFVPVACSTHVAEAVPGSQFVMLRDCGHFAYFEQPAALCATIVDFMSQR